MICYQTNGRFCYEGVEGVCVPEFESYMDGVDHLNGTVITLNPLIFEKDSGKLVPSLASMWWVTGEVQLLYIRR